MSVASHSEANILIVEDNPTDVLMTKMALKNAGFLKTPMVVDDGVPAISLLRRKDEFVNCPRPDLVILDLNLKCVDGPEVLEYIRREPQLSDLWVAVLSSSPTDIMVSRASEANCYFSKPSDVDSFLQLGTELKNSYISAMGPSGNVSEKAI